MKPIQTTSQECRQWADAWHAHRARAALESNLRRSGVTEEAFWARYATWVAAMQGGYPGILLERVVALVRPHWTVLDIGAGAGTFALPLAHTARSVTAIEPSPAQAKRLREAVRESKAHNISVVEKRWEDVDATVLGAHDFVLAVHSLQMEDIACALRKMCDAARQQVLLVHTAGNGLSQAIHELFGIEPGPDYLYLAHILQGLGHSPQIEFAEYGYDMPLDLQMEILEYNPGLTHQQCAVLHDYLVAQGMTAVTAEGAVVVRRVQHDALISVTAS